MNDRIHSGLGIASFVVSIVAGILLFLVIAVVGLMELSTPGGLEEDSAEILLIGVLAIAGVGAALLGLGLGVAGLLQKGRDTTFAVLGSVFSFAGIMGMIFLVLLGLTAP